MLSISKLKDKAKWVRRETLKIHEIAPGTRLASSLSDVEIFVALYYGKILNFNAKKPNWEKRDRFIISKPHGAISLYPVLADLGFFKTEELKRVGKRGSFLAEIPDTNIPGFETINGALGHGLGVACGVAIALKKEKSKANVFVLLGDGELYEGAVWEAIMFASRHALDNLIMIIDNNKISMLDYCKNIIDLSHLEDKFKTFKWKVKKAKGHNIKDLLNKLKMFKKQKNGSPKVLIANTVKGKGVLQLENDVLCHVRSFKAKEIKEFLKKL